MMSTPQPIRKACEALYEAMAELDNLEDRLEPASPATRGNFEECLEMLHELAVAKGFVTPSRRPRRSPSPDKPETAEDVSQRNSQEHEDAPASQQVRQKPTMLVKPVDDRIHSGFPS